MLVERQQHFPDGFLWGAATAAHQTEGNNVGSDLWWVENQPGSRLAERSGDACDSYHRWAEDLDLVAGAGFTAYRFGIEWARIEPTPGHVSAAQLAHYRSMIDGCRSRGITPVVTLHHFTNPMWFAASGGWTGPDAVATFAGYVESVLPILDGVEWVCTINEPNLYSMMLSALRRPGESGDVERPAVAGLLPAPADDVSEAIIAAHHAARKVLSAVPGLRSGWTIANQNFQPATDADADLAATRAWSWPREDRFIEAARQDDFVGVQAYTRALIGADGPVDAAAHLRRTQMGWEFYPDAVGAAVRHTASIVDVPIVVTENGIATADDTERIEYTSGALSGLAAAIADGVDVRGYLHWSLLDNYEWGSYRPTFGLVAVDRTTFVRTPKPSLAWLGERASTNRLP